MCACVCVHACVSVYACVRFGERDSRWHRDTVFDRLIDSFTQQSSFKASGHHLYRSAWELEHWSIHSAVSKRERNKDWREKENGERKKRAEIENSIASTKYGSNNV